MSKVFFKFNGEEGWIALGGHGIHDDGTRLLSAQCVTVSEIEEQAKHLKRMIDRAVVTAKRKLPHKL
jgi:hypothetical protein